MSSYWSTCTVSWELVTVWVRDAKMEAGHSCKTRHIVRLGQSHWVHLYSTWDPRLVERVMVLRCPLWQCPQRTGLKRNLFSTKACTATIWPAAIGSADLFCALENYIEMYASFASNVERGCACREWKGKLMKPFELHMSPTVLARIGPLCFSRSRLSSARRSSPFLLWRSSVQLQEVSMKSGTRQGARTDTVPAASAENKPSTYQMQQEKRCKYDLPLLVQKFPHVTCQFGM